MFKRWMLPAAMLTGLVLIAGCDAIKEAFEESMSGKSSDLGLFGEEYKPRYLFGLYARVKYPRGLKELERQITTFEGKRMWINTNQFMSSKHVKEIRIMPRADVPGAYDLALNLSDMGVRIWTMLAQEFAQDPLVMLIDDYYQCSFNPQPLPDLESTWVVINYPFDEVTAKGMEKFSKKNYKHLNPMVN